MANTPKRFTSFIGSAAFEPHRSKSRISFTPAIGVYNGL